MAKLTSDNVGSTEAGSETSPAFQKKKGRGGARPGAGGPRRPTKKTRDREAFLLSLIKDDVSERVLGTLTPLDVMALAMRKLIEAGKFIDAADIAARMAPYRHGRMGIIAPNTQDEHARIIDEIMNDPAPDLLDKGEE